MKIIADLHLHSKYSRAVSQRMEPVTIAQWAVRKGIDLVGTGDWTHPLWLKELEAGLEEIEEGVFGLRDSLRLPRRDIRTPREPKFLLSTEISSIYSQGGKSRRIHNLVMTPSFTTAHKINEELKNRGCNLMSDGRPIIGLSSQQLCELVWSIDESVLLVPAHAWTPWFSLYGSKSGFDSIEECFGEFSERIYAIETGLSSDPAMNWRIKELENRSIVSFSDAHSPQKLGREATVFKIKVKSQKSKVKSFSFQDLAGAIKQDKDSDWEIAYTIEFYPEEGKYHFTGHRNCEIKQTPEETFKKGSTCPVCGKPLTVGVMHRVEQLAQKGGKHSLEITKKKNEANLVGYYNAQDSKRPPYVMLVPLMEILAESLNTSVTSQKVIFEYKKLTENLASEFDVLMHIDLDKISRFAGSRVADAIDKVRSGNIVVEPGYDGVFGVVRMWSHSAEAMAGKSSLLENTKDKREQMSLF